MTIAWDSAPGPGKDDWRVQLWRASGLAVEDVRVGAGTRLRGHGHAEPHLLVLLEGALAERDGGRSREMQAGMLRLSPAGDEHDLRFLAPSRCLLVLLRSTLDPPSAGIIPAARRFASDPVGAALGASLARELTREDDPISPIAAQMLAYELLARVALNGSAREGSARRHPPSWLSRVREALHAEPTYPPDAIELAKDAGVHPVYLARVFRRHFGVGIGEYARSLRAEMALRRLIRSRDPLAVVAAASGYADQAHLTRSMRRLVGSTPAELRTRGGGWTEVAGVQYHGRLHR